MKSRIFTSCGLMAVAMMVFAHNVQHASALNLTAVPNGDASLFDAAPDPTVDFTGLVAFTGSFTDTTHDITFTAPLDFGAVPPQFGFQSNDEILVSDFPLEILFNTNSVSRVGFTGITIESDIQVTAFSGADSAIVTLSSLVGPPEFRGFTSDGPIDRLELTLLGAGSLQLDDFRFALSGPINGNQVPEPATAVLGLLGLSVFAFTLRRGRAQR